MRFEIVLAPEAIEDFRRLKASIRSHLRKELEKYLRHEPNKPGRVRIKRLRGLSRPQYRLRIGDIRVFYDVTGSIVEVLAIVPKLEADRWLAQFGSQK